MRKFIYIRNIIGYTAATINADTMPNRINILSRQSANRYFRNENFNQKNYLKSNKVFFNNLSQSMSCRHHITAND